MVIMFTNKETLVCLYSNLILDLLNLSLYHCIVTNLLILARYLTIQRDSIANYNHRFVVEYRFSSRDIINQPYCDSCLSHSVYQLRYLFFHKTDQLFATQNNVRLIPLKYGYTLANMRDTTLQQLTRVLLGHIC